MQVEERRGARQLAPAHPSLQRSEYLVSAAQAGSPAAFQELWNLYAQRVFQTIYRITKNREDAQDALQETFLRAHLALKTFEGRSSFYSWLTSIGINSALMLLRKRRKHVEVSLDDPHDEGGAAKFEVRDSGPSPEQICAQHQQYARVLLCIAALRPRLRQVIELRFRQSYSVREIAGTMGMSEAAVKACLARARARLRRGDC